MKTAFVIIVGEERRGDKALENTKNKLSEYFTLIQDPKSIQYDTSIYIIGHGNDPMLTNKMEMGDKTALQVFEKFHENFKQADFSRKAFCGKIILEGCHTAEASPDNRECFVKNGKIIPVDSYEFKSLASKSKISNNSLLVEFRKLFKDKFEKSTNVDPSTQIGGYLGAAFEGDYSETGFGKAGTSNPITIKFQESRKHRGEKVSEGIIYDETESFVEWGFKREANFGDKDVKNKNHSKSR